MYLEKSNSPKEWCVGSFWGNELWFHNKSYNHDIITKQKFNIEQAKIWEKAGGSSIALSFIHEVVESYIGGKLFPGESSNGSDYNYKICHALTVALECYEGEIPFYPELRQDKSTEKYYYFNKNEINEKNKGYYRVK